MLEKRAPKLLHLFDDEGARLCVAQAGTAAGFLGSSFLFCLQSLVETCQSHRKTRLAAAGSWMQLLCSFIQHIKLLQFLVYS